MKKLLFLKFPLLSIAFDALAHPGHDAGAGFALTGGQLLGLAAVAVAALAVVALQRSRRRKAARDDG